MRVVLAAAALLLSAGAASAQTAIPVGAPGIVIPAGVSFRSAIRFQAQGSGYACVSWWASAITISGNTAAATCTGTGAFLVTAGSTETRLAPAAVPGGPLYGVAATGAVLQLAYEIQ